MSALMEELDRIEDDHTVAVARARSKARAELERAGVDAKRVWLEWSAEDSDLELDGQPCRTMLYTDQKDRANTAVWTADGSEVLTFEGW